MRVFEILQYSKVQCNYVKKITEGLFIEYSMYESPMTMSKILYPLASPPKCWGPRLQPTKPIGKSGTESTYGTFIVFYILTRKNYFRYLKLMSPLNAAICTTIRYTLWVEWYYLKNNYLTLRSKVKVPQRSLRYVTTEYINKTWTLY